MRRLFALVLPLALTPALLPAADPAVVVRVRSVNDLLPKAEFLGALVGQAEPAKQGVGFVRSLIDATTGLAGIDPARPVGAYAVVAPDIAASAGVVVVPVADEDAVLDLMRDKLHLDPKKGGDGVYKAAVPNVPGPVFFRFAHKSVYLTIRSPKPLAPDQLIPPETLFAKAEDAVAAVTVHLDRIPEGVRKFVLGQVEMQAARRSEEAQAGESPAQKKFRLLAKDMSVAGLAAVLLDGTELTARLLVEPGTDDLSTVVTVAGRPGSPLAAVIAASPAGRPPAGGPSAMVRGGVRVSAPAAYRDRLNEAVDAAVSEAYEKAKPDDQKPVEMILDALTPTFKSGELDAAIVVTGPDAAGKVRVCAGVRADKGTAVEKTGKELARLAPNELAGVTFDTETVGGVKLHKVETKDGNLENTFGTRTVWLGTSDDRLLFAIEPEPALVRAAAKADEGAVPFLTADAAAARLMRAVYKDLPADKVGAVIDRTFPKGSDGTDAVSVSVKGGDRLTARVAVKGKVLQMLAALDQAKKAE